jgi:HrpA-like RNA helicase
VDARVGKLLLLAASLGCLAPVLTISACLSYKSPFAGGAQQDAAERARAGLAAPGSGTIAAGQQSDHLVMTAAVEGWLAARRKGGAKGEHGLHAVVCRWQPASCVVSKMLARTPWYAVLNALCFARSSPRCSGPRALPPPLPV